VTHAIADGCPAKPAELAVARSSEVDSRSIKKTSNKNPEMDSDSSQNREAFVGM
jgi:hypothetical protein